MIYGKDNYSPEKNMNFMNYSPEKKKKELT